ncbi:piggyBac transposable element-derived protein 3-like [Anastrepha ludens]|uniref:piggyBac transposable element-derived protein 3-like n=1 Tax=Anastrepha ludens TaxID=28586 RepID=UPI0023B1F1B2|nr:piggyBac transposable element-derived protein 3-like [Anastrepha ludens]
MRSKKCPLKTNKELQKKQRGEFDFMCSDSGILFVKWNDNSVVTVGTNFDRTEPLHTVKRWSRQERRKVNAHQPKLIAEYNSGMGGVDLHDQALNTYYIKFRGNKWWWPLFITMISSCVVNAWKLYKMASKSQCDLLQYQREIVRFYLRNYNIRDISSK